MLAQKYPIPATPEDLKKIRLPPPPSAPIVRLLTQLNHQHVLLTLVKLIINRWAWALVPTKLVELGNALTCGGGIHGNPANGPHQAPSHWTIQWNTYRPILTWPILQEEGRDGKNQSTERHTNSKLLQQHFAKNCKQATAYKSRGAPARGIGPPLV